MAWVIWHGYNHRAGVGERIMSKHFRNPLKKEQPAPFRATLIVEPGQPPKLQLTEGSIDALPLIDALQAVRDELLLRIGAAQAARSGPSVPTDVAAK